MQKVGGAAESKRRERRRKMEERLLEMWNLAIARLAIPCGSSAIFVIVLLGYCLRAKQRAARRLYLAKFAQKHGHAAFWDAFMND